MNRMSCIKSILIVFLPFTFLRPLKGKEEGGKSNAYRLTRVYIFLSILSVHKPVQRGDKSNLNPLL